MLPSLDELKKSIERNALNPREQRFVDSYVRHCNASRAAREAGYAIASAGQIGYELLNRPQIQAAIKQYQEELKARSQVSLEMIIEEMKKVAFTGPDRFIRIGDNGLPYFDFSDATPEELSAIQELTVDEYMDGRGEDAERVKRVKFKTGNKQAALMDLAKLLGLVVDKHEVATTVDVDPLSVIESRLGKLISSGESSSIEPGTTPGDSR